jgi:hypothetical protein
MYRDSEVGTSTSYGLECRRIGARVPVRVRFFPSTSSKPILGPTLPPIQWIPEALSSAFKWSSREADHSTPISAEVKKNVDLYIHSPILLHSVVHNSLSTGTTSPSQRLTFHQLREAKQRNHRVNGNPLKILT